MSETMKQTFGLVRRPWGVFYLKNKSTGQQTSLKTSDKHEAQRILQAHNESKSQPHFNISLARVYLNGADPKLATRTWQEVMENIVAKRTDETRRRPETSSLTSCKPAWCNRACCCGNSRKPSASRTGWRAGCAA